MIARRAFTLVEILVVVVILGILAMVVIPQLSTASSSARHAMLADNLRTLRTQLNVFKGQHVGVSPGYPNLDTANAPTEAAFVDHITKATTVSGDVADPGTAGYPYGSYMREIPVNPVNGKSTVQMLADAAPVPAVADDSHGWLFKPLEMIFNADCTGADQNGVDFIDY